MIIDLPALLRAVRTSLQQLVVPEVASDPARAQLASIDDVLGKLERMVVWSPQACARQAQVLTEGSAAFHARAQRAGLQPPPAPVTGRDAEADQILQAMNDHATRLTDWLFDLASTMDPAVFRELDAILRRALADQLVIGRKLIPLTDFAAMTTSAQS